MTRHFQEIHVLKPNSCYTGLEQVAESIDFLVNANKNIVHDLNKEFSPI